MLRFKRSVLFGTYALLDKSLHLSSLTRVGIKKKILVHEKIR